MRNGWKVKTIGDIASVKGGKRVPKGYKLVSTPTPYPYITVSDFGDDGTVETTNLKYIDEEVYEQIKRYTISSNDLYLSIAGTIGKTGSIPLELEGANLTENACKLVLHDEVNKKFVYYFTKSTSFIEQAGINTRVAAQPKLALERLKTISLPFPPLPEQKRIVAILDEAFAGIATAVTNSEKNLANARELFESHLNAVFTRKGDGWGEKKLGQVSENLDSKRVPITKNKRIKGPIPYYGASGIVDYVADYIFDEELLLVSEDGANLLARTYPIAFSVEGKAWVNNHAHVLRFEKRAYQKFIEYYLNSISLEPYVSGMAQPKLNQKSLNSITVPWHNHIDEVASVVDQITAIETKTQRLESIYQQKLDSLAELKQSILQKAFTGELTANPDKALKETGL